MLDVAKAFAGGTQASNLFEQTKRQNEIRALQKQISQQGAGFDPMQSQMIAQLSGLDPALAQRTIATFEGLSQGRQKAFFEDAKKGLDFLNQDRIGDAINLVNDRKEKILKMGGDTTDVDFIGTLLNQGQVDAAKNVLQKTVQLGIDSELLPDTLDGQPLFAPDPAEKKERRIQVLEAQLRAAQKTGDQASIKAAQSQLNRFEKLVGLDELTPQEKADIEVDKANRIQLAKSASKASSDAFTGLKTVRSTILNIGDAIRALDKGADTGPIVSKLPSFREASIELDNIRQRMGLDVVGSTTFGALSESELAFALDTALPDNLQPQALKAWLQRKKKAQTKLAKGLRDAASFLGKPGNTIADFIEKQELKAVSGDADSGLTPEEAEELRRLEKQFGEQ